MVRFVCRSFCSHELYVLLCQSKATRNTPLPSSLCRQMVQVHGNSPGNKRTEMKNITLKPAAPAKSSCCSRSWPYLLHANSVNQLFCHQFFDVTGCWRCLQYTRSHVVFETVILYSALCIIFCCLIYIVYTLMYVCMYVYIHAPCLFIHFLCNCVVKVIIYIIIILIYNMLHNSHCWNCAHRDPACYINYAYKTAWACI